MNLRPLKQQITGVFFQYHHWPVEIKGSRSLHFKITSSDESVLNDSFILNESLMWLEKNESSRERFVQSRMRTIL